MAPLLIPEYIESILDSRVTEMNVPPVEIVNPPACKFLIISLFDAKFSY